MQVRIPCGCAGRLAWRSRRRLQAAHAQALPGWKITDICAHESAPGQCAAFEGRALKAVSASWPFVLEPIRQACLAQLKSPYDQSWRSLAACLDGETLKALDKTAVHTATRRPSRCRRLETAMPPPSAAARPRRRPRWQPSTPKQ